MSDVIVEVEDGVGRITLNRPKAINALDHAMVREIAPVLAQWATDDAIDAVLLTGAGDRGLCAGGDVVSIYHDAKDGGLGTRDFWREEYILNAAIARFPKPFVSIMDGIVMGGGVGISAHANTRVVTERSKIAMPEVGIGFVPDVGGTYLLSRAPGEIGTHLALTTAPMNAADAIAAGFADHYIPSDKLAEFYEVLATASAGEAISECSEPAPESTLVEQRSWIDQCYSHDSVSGIVDALSASPIPQARKAARTILSKSPVALAVTLRSLRRAATIDSLEEALDHEYRVSIASLSSHDLVEGIRAQVVDKDRNPQWQPRTLADVTPEDIDRYFAPLGRAELGLSNASTEGEQS